MKAKLRFCERTQDGDSEGCLRLRRLPSPAQAKLIRDALGIRKRRVLSADQLACLRDRLTTMRGPHHV